MPDDPNLNQNPTQTFTPSNNGDDSAVQVPTPTPQIPSEPISTPVKETEPFYSEQNKPLEHVVDLSEKEPEIRPEIESAGVKVITDRIKLDDSQRQAGLSEAKESTFVVTTPSGKVSLPMDGIEAEKKAKGSTSNSITWLASLIQIFLKKLGGSAKAEVKKNV